MGRFVSNNRDPHTSAPNPPAYSNTPIPVDPSRTTSQLSSQYEFITSQPTTPFTNTPALPNVPLPPDTSPPPSPTPPSESDVESEPKETKTPETEEMAAKHVTPFHGDKEDESPEDFLRAYYRRMGDKSDEFKKAQFPYYLQADSVADEWFADLIDQDKRSWSDIEKAFMVRWPRKKQTKKTDDEYEDEITGRKLKTEDLGKKEKIAGREVYTHIAWADKMTQSVKGARWEKTTNQLRQVRKELPTILREKVGTGHADWNAFLKAVRDVDVEYIRDSIDIKNKEQAELDKRFKVLESLSRSPTAPLRQQLSTVSISSPAANSQVIGDPFLGAGGGRGNLTFSSTAAIPRPTKPPFANTNPRPPPTPEQKAEVRLLLNRFPHHPDTQAGRQAHQAQQAEWVKTFGYGTRVTEKTPYPLRPGTAPVNSGECFTCGQQGHLGVRTGETCEALGHRTLHPNEQQWRVICSRILKEPKVTTNVHLVAIDDYGTTLQDLQGNGEGPSS